MILALGIESWASFPFGTAESLGSFLASQLLNAAFPSPSLLTFQVFHFSQTKQDLATSILVCHQHRYKQCLHPLQNVRGLPRDKVQPRTVWRETCKGAAGLGRHLTLPLMLCSRWCRQGLEVEQKKIPHLERQSKELVTPPVLSLSKNAK